VERIDDEKVPTVAQPRPLVGGSKQKMAREVDARHVHPGTPRHLQIDDGEADGNARAAVEHLVQETISRIVVLVPVPGEPLLVVQVLVQELDGVLAAGACADHARTSFVAHPVDGIEVAPGVERRVLDARDRERGRGEILVRRVHCLLEIGRDLDAARLKMRGVFHSRDSTRSAQSFDHLDRQLVERFDDDVRRHELS
jgi:hypothetical protein